VDDHHLESPEHTRSGPYRRAKDCGVRYVSLARVKVTTLATFPAGSRAYSLLQLLRFALGSRVRAYARARDFLP